MDGKIVLKGAIMMDLTFKIPTFYKSRYGTDEEIDFFCNIICEIAKKKEYSKKVDKIDFIPIIIPKEMIASGKGKEFTKIELGYRVIALSRQIDFDLYYNANVGQKKRLLAECLIKGLHEVESKILFDINKFEEDIRSIILS